MISSAVRMRAISVDVKWTVMSSLEMGMFMRTRRWGRGAGQGQACRVPPEHSVRRPLAVSPAVPGARGGWDTGPASIPVPVPPARS